MTGSGALRTLEAWRRASDGAATGGTPAWPAPATPLKKPEVKPEAVPAKLPPGSRARKIVSTPNPAATSEALAGHCDAILLDEFIDAIARLALCKFRSDRHTPAHAKVNELCLLLASSPAGPPSSTGPPPPLWRASDGSDVLTSLAAMGGTRTRGEWDGGLGYTDGMRQLAISRLSGSDGVAANDAKANALRHAAITREHYSPQRSNLDRTPA